MIMTGSQNSGNSAVAFYKLVQRDLAHHCFGATQPGKSTPETHSTAPWKIALHME